MSSVLDGFDFGPDVDPTHDPVFDPDAAPSAAAGDAQAQTGAPGDGATAGTATDLPPADRAWQLFCQGMTYSAIARELGIDRHTVARSVRQLHEETQAERRADRALALTRALGALERVQATAWERLALDQGHERVVWDLYTRAAAQAAQMKGSLAGGYTVPPPTFHARATGLLRLILAAVREAARLELLYDAQAPARDGDAPAEGEGEASQDRHLYIMMRRSDTEEALRTQPPAQESAATPSTADTAQERAANEGAATGTGDLPAPAVEVRDAQGNVPQPHVHPQPDPRPDGTDDWYVYAATPLASPRGAVPQRPGQPPRRRRRPWDHAR